MEIIFWAMVDTSFVDESSARYTSLPLYDTINAMESNDLAIKILVIDGCRKGGFGSTRSMLRELAPVSAPKGILIAFATSPGQAVKEVNYHGFLTSAIL